MGHELDWLAFEIRRNFPDESNLQDNENHRDFLSTLRKFEGWWTSKFSEKGQHSQPQPASREENCGPSYHEGSINPTSQRQLLSIRQRLAHITGNIPEPGYMGKEEYQLWEDNYIKVRTKAKALSAAICTIADDFISKGQHSFDIHLQIPDILQRELNWIKTPETGIEVLLKKPDEVSATGWTTDAARLEALLGLAMWTMVSDNRLIQIGEDSAAETIESVRIISLATENSREINLWYGDVVSNSKCASLKLNLREKHGLFDLWQKPSALNQRDRHNATSGQNPTPSVNKWRGDEPMPKGAVRFCGWTAVTEYLKGQVKNTEDDGIGSIDVEFVRTRSSLLDTCAHELFTILLAGLKDKLQTSCLKHKLTINDSKFDRSGFGIRLKSPTVAKLVDIFVNADLGSAAEGLLCVIPALRSQFSTDNLELEILTAFTDHQVLEMENALKYCEHQLDGHSISPYLRTLCAALRFVQEGGSRNRQYNRDSFKVLREGWRNSTSPYKNEILEILGDYDTFLTKVDDDETTSHEVAPDISDLTTDLDCGHLETTFSYLAKRVKSRSLKRSEFSADGLLLLNTAVKKRLVGVVCILLNMGVNSTQKEIERTHDFPFLLCFKHDKYEVCARILINHGALDNPSQWAIGDLLTEGVRSRAENMVNLLIDLRKVHYDGYMRAISNESAQQERGTPIFKGLLKRAIDNGINPMAIVQHQHSERYNEFQLDMLLSLEEVRVKHGQALLSWALDGSPRRSLYGHTIQKLVQDGVQPDQPLGTPDGNTALHVAVLRKTFLEILIDTEGLNLEVKNDDGQTPFCRAVCLGQHESATLLLKKGALVETTSGQRPMDCAVQNKDDQMMQLLRDNSANLSEGQTDPKRC